MLSFIKRIFRAAKRLVAKAINWFVSDGKPTVTVTKPLPYVVTANTEEKLNAYNAFVLEHGRLAKELESLFMGSPENVSLDDRVLLDEQDDVEGFLKVANDIIAKYNAAQATRAKEKKEWRENLQATLSSEIQSKYNTLASKMQQVEIDLINKVSSLKTTTLNYLTDVASSFQTLETNTARSIYEMTVANREDRQHAVQQMGDAYVDQATCAAEAAEAINEDKSIGESLKSLSEAANEMPSIDLEVSEPLVLPTHDPSKFITPLSEDALGEVNRQKETGEKLIP